LSLLRAGLIGLAFCLAAGGAQAAAHKMYSYDPANSETRHAAGGLTFEFEKKFVFNTILNLRSTMGQATAYLTPADERALGASLSSLIGDRAQERDLYEVKPEREGEALVSAYCPGSKRGFITFGRLRANRPLRVHVLGDNPAGGPARLCRTFDFTFHGEWQLPTQGVPVRERDLKRPKFPY
jgi:hypothetical protein